MSEESVISSTGESKEDFLSRKKEELVKLASANFIQQRSYKSPFLSLSDLSIPDQMTDLFKWCKYFYTFDPVIHGAVNALSTFPVTQVSLEESDEWITKKKEIDGAKTLLKESDQMKSVRYMLFDRIKIYKLLIEIGIDYFLYGNCFVLGEMAKNSDGKKEWKRVQRISPDSIIIDYLPDGNMIYKWNPPERIKMIIKKKAPAEAYERIPKIVVEAVQNNKSIVIDNSRIYHFKKPSDSLLDSAWGTPGVANVLKLLMYRNILRQAQEAIAREHIVPFRIFFLNPQGGMPPGMVGSMSMGGQGVSNPSSALAREIEKASADPNYKIVSNVPIGMVTAGGHGRSLLLTPEIDQIQTEILAGMNVPREFIFGGLSYSGSSISLKILENHFITYRLLLEDFINSFIIKELAKARGEWENEDDTDNLVKASLTDLKMQDDIQQKQMILNLNMSGKVSDSFMLRHFGIDSEKEINAIKEETKIKGEIERSAMLSRLETDTKMKKAGLIQQLELQMFERKLREYIDTQGDYTLDQYDAEEVIKKIEESISKERLKIHDYQVSKAEEREEKRTEDFSDMASIIIDNYERDADYGESLMRSFSGRMSKDSYAGMLYKIRELLDVQDNPDLFENLARVIDEELISKGFSSHEDVMRQRQAEYEERQMEEAAMAEEQSANQAQVSEQSGETQSQGGENIDMRPMPEQRPPRRSSLGNG